MSTPPGEMPEYGMFAAETTDVAEAAETEDGRTGSMARPRNAGMRPRSGVGRTERDDDTEVGAMLPPLVSRRGGRANAREGPRGKEWNA
jgi:hypothetical protein